MKNVINNFKDKLEDMCIKIATLNYIYEDNSSCSDIIYCPTCESSIRITRSLVGYKINQLENMIEHESDCPKIKAMSIVEEFEKITKDIVFIPAMKK